MAFAIYGESLGYVHLIASDDSESAVAKFVTDIESVGVSLKDVYNVTAVENLRQDTDLEDRVRKLIREARDAQ
jgi:hypothetical protein